MTSNLGLLFLVEQGTPNVVRKLVNVDTALHHKLAQSLTWHKTDYKTDTCAVDKYVSLRIS